MSGRVSAIESQVQKNKFTAQKERRLASMGDYSKGWSNTDYGSDHKNYASWFDLSEDFFLKKVKTIKKSGREVFGLDVMSNTAFLRSLEIKGIAIELTKDKKEENAAKVYDRYIVAGDLLEDRKKIWSEVDEVMVNHNFNHSFDLITLKGVGGLPGLTKSPMVHYLLLEEMWKRLAFGGTLVSEIPDIKTAHLLIDNNVVAFWNTIPGIKVEVIKNRTIIFEKGKGAPQSLPLNFSPLLRTIKDWNSLKL